MAEYETARIRISFVLPVKLIVMKKLLLLLPVIAWTITVVAQNVVKTEMSAGNKMYVKTFITHDDPRIKAISVSLFDKQGLEAYEAGKYKEKEDELFKRYRYPYAAAQYWDNIASPTKYLWTDDDFKDVFLSLFSDAEIEDMRYQMVYVSAIYDPLTKAIVKSPVTIKANDGVRKGLIELSDERLGELYESLVDVMRKVSLPDNTTVPYYKGEESLYPYYTLSDKEIIWRSMRPPE